jgi:hypothetical protein
MIRLSWKGGRGADGARLMCLGAARVVERWHEDRACTSNSTYDA